MFNCTVTISNVSVNFPRYYRDWRDGTSPFPFISHFVVQMVSINCDLIVLIPPWDTVVGPTEVAPPPIWNFGAGLMPINSASSSWLCCSYFQLKPTKVNPSISNSRSERCGSIGSLSFSNVFDAFMRYRRVATRGHWLTLFSLVSQKGRNRSRK